MAKSLVQVCGDPTVDWLSVHNEDLITSGGVHPYRSDRPAPGVRLSSQAGGSALVLQLLREMIDPELAQVEGRDLDARLLEQPRDNQRLPAAGRLGGLIRKIKAALPAFACWSGVYVNQGSGTMADINFAATRTCW